MHALVRDGSEPVGHGSVVLRRFLHAGRTWRVGYVEAVAVAPGARRRGHGSAVMRAVESRVRGGHEVGAPSATDDGAPLYPARGRPAWGGPPPAPTPRGAVRPPGADRARFLPP